MYSLTIRVSDLANVPIPPNAKPEAVLTPSEQAYTAGGTLISEKPVIVPLGLSGTGITDIVSVTDVPKVGWHYRIALRWLNPDGYAAGSGYTVIEFPEMKLFPGVGAGSISDIAASGPVTSQWIYVSLTEPTAPTKGFLWLNADKYNPELGTGDLKEWT